MKLFLIFFLLFCFKSEACPEAFNGDSETKRDEITKALNLRLDIGNIPIEDLNKFSLEDIIDIPVKDLTVKQIVSLKDTHVNAILENRHLQKNSRAFSFFIRLHIENIYPRNIPLLLPRDIRIWKKREIEKITLAQIPYFDFAQISAFNLSIVEVFSVDQIIAFGKKIRWFSSARLGKFSHKQTEALTLKQLAVLDRDQIESLQYLPLLADVNKFDHSN